MNFECMMDASNRSRASLMALSPRPTMETEGGPNRTSVSTSTTYPSIPDKVKLCTVDAIIVLPPFLVMICFLALLYLYTRDSTSLVGQENMKEFDG